MTEEDFIDSFVMLEQVVASYNNLWYVQVASYNYSKNPQLRPPSGLDQSGLNCGVVLIVDILIIAYTRYDQGLF
jgi:hypothetical protein